MKALTTSSLMIALGLTSNIALADKHRFYDYADVTHVTPIYESVRHSVPEENCWSEPVRVEPQYRQHNSATSTIVGGVIGGAIGHAVGRGKSNKRLGTVVGSVLGMSVGNDIGRRHAHQQRHVRYENVERCEVSYRNEYQQQLTGYDVSYFYKGENYTTRMSEHPGHKLRVAVSVTPAQR